MKKASHKAPVRKRIANSASASGITAQQKLLWHTMWSRDTSKVDIISTYQQARILSL